MGRICRTWPEIENWSRRRPELRRSQPPEKVLVSRLHILFLDNKVNIQLKVEPATINIDWENTICLTLYWFFPGNIFHFHYGKGPGRSRILFRFLDLSGTEFWNVFRKIFGNRKLSGTPSGNRKISGTHSRNQKISRTLSGNRKISGNWKIFLLQNEIILNSLVHWRDTKWNNVRSQV